MSLYFQSISFGLISEVTALAYEFALMGFFCLVLVCWGFFRWGEILFWFCFVLFFSNTAENKRKIQIENLNSSESLFYKVPQAYEG